MPFEMDSTISIHAPPARGATPDFFYYRGKEADFNPRPPARGATSADI